ncbi:DNA repair protein RAD5 [Cryptococcus neoformans]|nr:DNA repair protein RAD5 [Cryptococcus neoformans var. grubii]
MSAEASPETGRFRTKSSPDLFFPATDSEDEEQNDVPPTTVQSAQSISSKSSINAASSSRPQHGSDTRAFAAISQTSFSAKAQDDSDDDFSIVGHNPASSHPQGASAAPRKKRSLQQAHSHHSSPSSSPAPPDSMLRADFRKGFLGEFVCEGWSLSKGRGYCSPGTKIVIERPKSKSTDVDTPKSRQKDNGPVRLVNGKVVGGVKSKQMTLGSMMAKKVEPAKKVKATTDQIIRFRNERGFEIGRLSIHEAGFLTHLLDTGVIQLSGNVIDCPQNLTTGCTILLNVKVYLARKAFENPGKQKREEHFSYWLDQRETGVEEAMRLRKDSLRSLFDRIGVKPIQSSALSKVTPIQGVLNRQKGSDLEGSRLRPSPSTSTVGEKGKGREITPAVDDDGEDSGDEAEKLDEKQMNEIDSIYRKAQQSDTRLDEMDPPSTFLYTLRPYQKQALTWMNAREKGDSSIRDESLHPLWEEYLFKKDQLPGEPIEISDDDEQPDSTRKFYWNPYSGELSLKFPTSKNLSRGGILADAMGMGKTCMMASLIHTNREEKPVGSLEPQTKDVVEGEIDEESASKRIKFKQVTLSNQWRAVPTAPKLESFPRATLVVCPVSLAAQWHDELRKMSQQGSINSYVWYGGDRVDIEALLAGDGKERVDVIVTSYGTLSSEYQKWMRIKDKPSYEGGSLYDHEFLRIVLDEAHIIRNRLAVVSKACYELKGQRRWALTGTPIVNRLEDLYSLLHFLRVTPWGDYSFFRSFVTVPFLNQDHKALNVVQYILESCLLRREKTMRDKDGRLIVDLPPKTVEIKVLQFSRAERQIYKFLEERAKKRFIELDADGRAMSNYTSILAMLMKLRQCVDHPLLVLGKSGEDGELGEKILESGAGNDEGNLREMIAMYAGGVRAETPEDVDKAYAAKVLREIGEQEDTPICELCSNEMFDEVLLPCYHRSCQDCIVEWIGTCEDQNKLASCPSCGKGPIKLADLRSVQRRHKRVNPITGAYPAGRDQNSKSGNETTVTLGKVDLVTSTKLRALLRQLEEIRQEDPKAKVLIFSQFTSFLDLIETTLTKQGIRRLRFDGTMSQAQRASTIEEFGQKTDEPLILLISLKAGGVGLNLTMANYVFLMDTWWNEAIEQQAIDRVHRLGQNKPVYVTRYIIKGTVEKRIMKIQRSKTALINASLSKSAKTKETTLADIKKIFGMDEEDSEEEVY